MEPSDKNLMKEMEETMNELDELMKESAALVQEVWEKAELIEGLDPGEWRKDDRGNRIHRDAYGERHSPFGWRWDYTAPQVARRGDSITTIVRPLRLNADR